MAENRETLSDRGTDTAYRSTDLDEGQIAQVIEALKELDPDNDRHWNPLGLPQLAVMRKRSGLPNLTRAELSDISEGLTREGGPFKPSSRSVLDAIDQRDQEIEDLRAQLAEMKASQPTPDAIKALVNQGIQDGLKARADNENNPPAENPGDPDKDDDADGGKKTAGSKTTGQRGRA